MISNTLSESTDHDWQGDDKSSTIGNEPPGESGVQAAGLRSKISQSFRAPQATHVSHAIVAVDHAERGGICNLIVPGPFAVGKSSSSACWRFCLIGSGQ